MSAAASADLSAPGRTGIHRGAGWESELVSSQIVTNTVVAMMNCSTSSGPVTTRSSSGNRAAGPRVNVVVLSDDFGSPWVQIDGDAEVIDVPEAVESLVSYYRATAGEHPNWAKYRAAMLRRGKSLLRITPRRWGPVATGGFPPAGEAGFTEHWQWAGRRRAHCRRHARSAPVTAQRSRPAGTSR